MYLVEYTKKYENEEKHFCLGYYSREVALLRAQDILSSPSTKSVVISQVNSLTKIYDIRSLNSERINNAK